MKKNSDSKTQCFSHVDCTKMLFTFTNSIFISISQCNSHGFTQISVFSSSSYVTISMCISDELLFTNFPRDFSFTRAVRVSCELLRESKPHQQKKLTTLGCCRKFFLHSQVGFSCKRTPKKFFHVRWIIVYEQKKKLK